MITTTVVSKIEETIVEKLRKLSPEKQQETLDFVEFLEQKAVSPEPTRRSLKGALSHLNVHVTTDDIREARREMWREYVGEGQK